MWCQCITISCLPAECLTSNLRLCAHATVLDRFGSPPQYKIAPEMGCQNQFIAIVNMIASPLLPYASLCLFSPLLFIFFFPTFSVVSLFFIFFSFLAFSLSFPFRLSFYSSLFLSLSLSLSFSFLCLFVRLRICFCS